MGQDALFRHLMNHLFPYYYAKYHNVPGFKCVETFVPKEALTENLFDIIAKAMHLLEDFIIYSWIESLKYNSETVKDFEIYILQVMMFCIEKKTLINDIYERFIHVCALVTVIGLHTLFTTGKKFYKLTPRILTVFFEKALKEDFRKRGGWKRLEKYMMQQDYLEYHELICVAKIPCVEFDERLIAFASQRRHVYSPFLFKREEKEYDFASDLTVEVISFIEASLRNELRSSTQYVRPSPFNFQELISGIGKLKMEEEIGESSKASGEDSFYIEELYYETNLESHIVKLKRLINGFNLNTEISSIGESSDNAINLITGLRHLQLKIEYSISLLDSVL
ncbi:uncharacterized protein TNIN_137311 [Trichonephila inaurata madagascariensis]|uniref:Uncharacterized protein n=1 Tax=Trichonephila inaurata madagascariensis TaxID=2747483 RepID=A0A8X6WTN0_9ARAC|nr:uncharacterized protein TNIN_137311 [Trichonephila inaurata madagascariensis]